MYLKGVDSIDLNLMVFMVDFLLVNLSKEAYLSFIGCDEPNPAEEALVIEIDVLPDQELANLQSQPVSNKLRENREITKLPLHWSKSNLPFFP